MKYFYFVRHGESESNVGDFHSGSSTPLTQKGREQAQAIAERCASLPLEALIVSTYIRTKQTAEYIIAKTGLKPEESNLFTENRFISAFEGKLREDPESQAALKLVMENWGKPGFHVADEENFDDIRVRAAAALEFLANRKEQHVGIVSHGGFLRNVVGQALFAEQFDARVSNIFYHSLHVMENTALTVMTYDEENAAYPWRLVVWNDQAHL